MLLYACSPLSLLMSLCPQQVTFLVPSRDSIPFEPKELTPDGHVSILEFCLFLCQEVYLLLQSTYPYSDPHSVIHTCPNSNSFNHSFLHSSYHLSLTFPTSLQISASTAPSTSPKVLMPNQKTDFFPRLQKPLHLAVTVAVNWPWAHKRRC